jgi:hypothetical protein
VIHRSTSTRAALVALLLTVVAPAAINASTQTPLNINLAQNKSFEDGAPGITIPSWTVTGDAHVETFGTKPWPTQAYSNSWSGGTKYVACTTAGGSVSQTVPWNGWTAPHALQTVRLTSYYGGTTGHNITVSLQITGDSNETPVFKQKTKALTTTNHYLKAVVSVGMPSWGKHIKATITLTPKAGAKHCKIMSDVVTLTVFNT